jgi:hypothetical protein
MQAALKNKEQVKSVQVINVISVNNTKSKEELVLQTYFPTKTIAGSYLQYIVDNYEALSAEENLTNWHLFAPSQPHKNVDESIIANIIEQKTSFINNSNSAGFAHIGKYMALCDIQGGMHLQGLRTWEVWNELFIEPTPQIFNFCEGNAFIVSNENILIRPLSFYKQCLLLSIKHEQANEIFERIWQYIFNTNIV